MPSPSDSRATAVNPGLRRIDAARSAHPERAFSIGLHPACVAARFLPLVDAAEGHERHAPRFLWSEPLREERLCLSLEMITQLLVELRVHL